jgi:D-lyxose ketol-isomerase
MKRTEVNQLMRKALDFFQQHHFIMPPYATWSARDWQKKGPECKGIIEQHLGWDITDFGSGDFYQTGLLLFTLRNGSYKDIRNAMGKSYAEKIMIVEENQVTPTHFHFHKMEDIINRGGGILMIQLWNSSAKKEFTNDPVSVFVDGMLRRVEAGGIIELNPGESICLPQRLYHKFWGKKGSGTILVGEVSRMNDDYVDNYFYEPVGRFASIEEDQEPLYLLANDYQHYYAYYENIARPV